MRNLVFAVIGRNEAALRMVIHELVQMFGRTIAIAKQHCTAAGLSAEEREFLIESSIDELHDFKIENDLIWNQQRRGPMYGLAYSTLNSVMKQSFPILICTPSCVSELVKLSYQVEVIRIVTDAEGAETLDGWEATTHPTIEPGFQLYWDTAKTYDFDVRLYALAAHITHILGMVAKPRH